MQAAHRRSHRVLWIAIALIVGVSLWIALTNNDRAEVKQLIETQTES